jgi:uncharacterized protein involved in exopolysaccharide biosynthesis
MTIGTLASILKSRLWLLLLLPLVSASTALWIDRSRPPAYAADATLLLDYRRPMEGELAGELLPVGLQPSYLSTQVDIIRSRPVAERVVESLGLGSSPLWRQRFEASAEPDRPFETWLTDTLLEYLKVQVGAETRLIDVWYRDSDPRTAAAVANGFVEAYREIVRQLGQSPASETAGSVEKVLAKLREGLEEAEGKASAYQARMGITATEERLDVETSHLSELMRERLAADAAVRAADSRLGALEELKAKGSAGSAPEAIGNDLIQGLTLELGRKEGEVAELATTLGDRHPRMQDLKAQLKSLRQRLDGETDKLAVAARGELSQARRLAESAEQAETAQRERLLELKHSRDGLQPLLRELESARTSYDRALQMYSEYALHSDMIPTNVAVLDPARVPTTPVEPNPLLNASAAFAAGLALAIGLALLWELADRRVRHRRDLVGAIDGVFLGSLPPAGR